MIIAVVAMRMVEVTVDEIANVVAVGDGLVSAAGAVFMVLGMPSAGVLRRAAGGVGGRDFDHVLIDMTVVHVMQMAIMQIVDVASMLHSGMTAAGPVDMRMVGVFWVATGHDGLRRRALVMQRDASNS
jgi:hypothetical protein